MNHRLIGLLLILASLSLGWAWMDYQAALDRPADTTQPSVFEIPKGQGLSATAEALRSAGLLTSPLWFRLYAYLSGDAKRLKHGEYEIPPHPTPVDLLALFVAGKVKQHVLTIPEGWTFRQIQEALRRQPALAFDLDARSPPDWQAELGLPHWPPEGWLFPDSYFFPKGTSASSVLRSAHRKMQSLIDQEWPQRAADLPLNTPLEALILASIVEKETARTDERPLIAGVFIRRLRLGMPLQTDPTVIYGMGERFQGNLRKADLQTDTPYNTYTRKGLPPTPIAAPGRDAIHASLHPDAGESLYFVARGDGSHQFSKTYDEHRKAVATHQTHP